MGSMQLSRFLVPKNDWTGERIGRLNELPPVEPVILETYRGRKTEGLAMAQTRLRVWNDDATSLKARRIPGSRIP